MITKKILYRGEAAKNTHYYGDQTDDYYARDINSAVWQGEGARMLGLNGEVHSEDFHNMLAGRFGMGVETGNSIRKDAKARAGLDLTISAPKSVTLQALVGGDERVIAAHDKAVSETLEFIEENLAQSRQTIDGENHVRNTGNLVVAKFRHETARATDNSVPDPQLHTHAVIMNVTRREDGSWASLHNDKIVKMRKLQDTVYMAALSRELKALGYEVRHEKNHIELAHISREQIEHFSKRSQDISARLQAQGLEKSDASHAHRQVATLATRNTKTDEFTREDLYQQWVTQAGEVGMQLSQETGLAKDRAINTPRQVIDDASRMRIAQAALIWAIKHHSERETVMAHQELVSSAISHADGLVSAKDIQDSIRELCVAGKLIMREDRYISNTDLNTEGLTREGWAKAYAHEKSIPLDEAFLTVNKAIEQGRLSQAPRQYATTKAYEIEKNMLAMEMQGRGQCTPIFEHQELSEQLEQSTLTPGQKDTVSLMLNGKNQIVGVQGLAGTGKSYALQQTQKLLNERGYKMIALAPYGTQVNNLREDGIEANTVASQLTATETERLQSKLGEKTVVVIDEAGVIPVRQMEQLLRRLQPSGSRVVLLGDTAQTKAVEAGRAFALLQEQGMETALMGDIQRQKSEHLKRAVELAAQGQARDSLELIDKVMEVPDRTVTLESGETKRDGQPRYEAIAKEYVALSKTEQAETLIVTGTNASRKAINDLVRKYRGLKGQGHKHSLLTRHDTTRMQRRHAKYYTVGDVVQPERDYKNGLERGVLYEVIKRDLRKDRLIVRELSGGNNKEVEVIPKLMSTLSIYNKHEAEIAAGDVVRVTRNNAELDLANGERYEVLDVTEDAVTIAANGRAVKLAADEPLHLDHAYATTAHSSQGLTCNRVFYNAETTSRTTAQDTYYVSISRERHEVVVFTDNAQRLPDAVEREAYKGVAHDLVAQELQKTVAIRDFAKNSPELSTGPAH